MTSWKNIPIKECGEPLVPLGPFTPYHFLGGSSIYYGQRIDSPYYPNGLRGALLTHFVRESVAERLKKASSLLPKGIMLWLWDSYRNLETQKAIFDSCQEHLTTAHPDWEKDHILQETERFVSLPSDNPEKPSPHSTGGSVDITLVRFPFFKWFERRILLHFVQMYTAQNNMSYWKILYVLHMRLMDIDRRYAQLLPMGTLFDEVKPETAAYYFEMLKHAVPEQKIIQKNRALLRRSMQVAGFTQYKDEWWHYNCRNQMWAEEFDAPFAIYGAVTLSEKNTLWETMRREHFIRQTYWQEHDTPLPEILGKFGKIYIRNEAIDFAKKWARTFGDPTFSTHPKASLM